MQRRDVLKLLGSATALSALPLEALTLIEQASAQASASTVLRTLDPHQNATVVTIAELIIPATDTPGATGAKVNEFIDLLLTEWYDPAETKLFLAGLANVDKCSKEKFSAAFVDCNASQQAELMQQFDGEAMEFAAKQKAAMQAHAEVPPMNFFYQMKKLTLAGYYTSQIGFSQELGRVIIPPGHAGCVPLQVKGQGGPE
jgi:gluconate 2-dehydrogenase gamma chain